MKLPNITIVATFRDSNVDAFAAQCYNLDYPPSKLRFICVEGDSVDETYSKLLSWEASDTSVTVIKKDVNLPKHGSVINPERMWILATVYNAGLNAVDLGWSDYVMSMPSDVIFTPDLTKGLLSYDKDLIAPWFWTKNEHGVTRFYDTWAFCYQGQYFEQAPASWFASKFPGTNLLKMDTIGGVYLMKSKVIESGCRVSEIDGDRGLCKMAREKGFEVWATFNPCVFHP